MANLLAISGGSWMVVNGEADAGRTHQLYMMYLGW